MSECVECIDVGAPTEGYLTRCDIVECRAFLCLGHTGRHYRRLHPKTVLAVTEEDVSKRASPNPILPDWAVSMSKKDEALRLCKTALECLALKYKNGRVVRDDDGNLCWAWGCNSEGKHSRCCLTARSALAAITALKSK